MVSFLIVAGARQWYDVGAYVPPNNVPAVHHAEQELKLVPNGLQIILMGGLNLQLRKPRDERKEEFPTELEDRGLVSMTDHFMPQWRYRGAVSWTWIMQ